MAELVQTYKIRIVVVGFIKTVSYMNSYIKSIPSLVYTSAHNNHYVFDVETMHFDDYVQVAATIPSKKMLMILNNNNQVHKVFTTIPANILSDATLVLTSAVDIHHPINCFCDGRINDTSIPYNAVMPIMDQVCKKILA